MEKQFSQIKYIWAAYFILWGWGGIGQSTGLSPVFKAIYYSLLARGYFCRLLKTFENLDSVQDQHNVIMWLLIWIETVAERSF